MKPSQLENHIRYLKAYVSALESYLGRQRHRHAKLDDGNGTYDPIYYHVTQLFIHLGMLNSDLDRRKSFEGADGNGKQFLTLLDGSKMKCYVGHGEPAKEW